MARKILLADDSVTAQNMGRKILADAGYEVITVNNGSAALKRITEQKPDVIVLDVYMPGYSGLEVCQRLKEVGETAGIPILLTVGKLEPFKPEEVKRVRADGFIVKPFEASELLSALSKLEDRIVPRAEASKSGRFSRAAALDQPAYDKTVAIEEDTSWKNRITFPSKKKEQESRPEVDDPAVYNQASKDLRTVIEHKIEETSSTGKAEEGQRVDLGALAPAGLPKDVTPEEIAAIAAAAAQMQSTVAGSKTEESAPTVQSEPVVPVEAKLELKETERGHKPHEHIDDKEVVAIREVAKPEGTSERDASPLDEPVTMAVSASIESAASPSRWTAVSVALAPEEAVISLEQEMRKAYSDFAAAESGHGSTVATESPNRLPADSASVSPIETPAVSEPFVAVPASPAPEAAQSLAEVASAATTVVSAAAEQLEAVAASLVVPNDSVAADSAISAEATIASPVEKDSDRESGVSGPSSASVEAEKAKPEASQSEPGARQAEEGKEEAAVAHVPAVESNGSVADVSSSQNAPTVESKPQAPEAGSKEPDFAATTAAAWASWHRIRESGNDAVKAVAAGAESNPTEVAAEGSSDPAIASIVDSVLADLRPKIVEEISRKLGKKQ